MDRDHIAIPDIRGPRRAALRSHRARPPGYWHDQLLCLISFHTLWTVSVTAASPAASSATTCSTWPSATWPPSSPSTNDWRSCARLPPGRRGARFPGDRLPTGRQLRLVTSRPSGSVDGTPSERLSRRQPGPADDATLVTVTPLRDHRGPVDAGRALSAGRSRDPRHDETGYAVADLSTPWPTCLSCWSGGCARTGPRSETPGPPALGPGVASPAGTAASSSSPSQTAGSPRSPPARPPPATARPGRSSGTGCTPDSPTAAPG